MVPGVLVLLVGLLVQAQMLCCAATRVLWALVPSGTFGNSHKPWHVCVLLTTIAGRPAGCSINWWCLRPFALGSCRATLGMVLAAQKTWWVFAFAHCKASWVLDKNCSHGANRECLNCLREVCVLWAV